MGIFKGFPLKMPIKLSIRMLMPEKEEEINTTEIQPKGEIQDPPFYNVLPKSQANGALINPKIKIEAEDIALASPETKIQMLAKKYKIALIIIGAVVILAYPAYYLLNKFIFTPVEPDNLLILPGNMEVGNKTPEENPKATNTQTSPEWQKRFFSGEKCFETENCGDEADPDKDGLKNLAEFNASTDPNNSDSDQDGLADGDEVNIFSSDPTKTSTIGDIKYNDGQYIKGGYDALAKDKQFTTAQIAKISIKMKTFGIHPPTNQTLGESLLTLYKFSTEPDLQKPKATTTPNSDPFTGVDTSAEAKQDRDTQRSTTIKNIAMALVKYFDDKKTYPKITDFGQMFLEVKIYSRVAVNPEDPINKDKYIYTYASEKDGQDFVLTFFSESQNQSIKTRSVDGKKYISQDQSAIYDDQRKTNLETLRSALLLYSSQNTSGNKEYVFPVKEQLQTALVPQLITEIPKDPKTNEAYDYQVSEDFESFTLKALLDAPPVGKSGYLCNQEECRVY